MKLESSFNADKLLASLPGLENRSLVLNHSSPVLGDNSEASDNDSVISYSASSDDQWSDSSVSSQTSAGALASYGGQDFVLQAYTELLLDDVVFYELLKAIESDIGSERLRRELVQLLKCFGISLRREAVTTEQHRISQFIRRKAKQVVPAILQQLGDSEAISRSQPMSEPPASGPEDDSE